jgi:hypothetical protein
MSEQGLETIERRCLSRWRLQRNGARLAVWPELFQIE